MNVTTSAVVAAGAQAAATEQAKVEFAYLYGWDIELLAAWRCGVDHRRKPGQKELTKDLYVPEGALFFLGAMT